MSAPMQNGERERIYALLADRATQALSDDEEHELERLLAVHPEIDVDQFDRVAAELDLYWIGDRVEVMPAHVRGKIHASARTHLPRASRARALDPLVVVGRFGGWIAAAAAIVALIAIWPRDEAAPSLAEQRAELIRRASDEVELAWSPTAGSFSGDVVWSPSAQQGFLRFRGLAKNDPRVQQYQLWIFDKQQDERYPIDGGVFDIDREDGDVIVPIRAKLRVQDLAMFAVTREKPGGVVVSSREGLVGLAQL